MTDDLAPRLHRCYDDVTQTVQAIDRAIKRDDPTTVALVARDLGAIVRTLEAQALVDARDAGATWTELAREYRITPQAMQARARAKTPPS